MVLLAGIFSGCPSSENQKDANADNFEYVVDRFADLQVLRYQVPGFDELSLKQKKLIYYLSEAAKCGRDILFDQNGRYNLLIRRTLENIYSTYNGNTETEDYKDFLVYLKRVWFSNGIYHHYASDKITPDFSKEYFKALIAKSDKSKFPVMEGKTVDETIDFLIPIMFDKDIMPKKVNQNPNEDMVTTSAVNFYQGVTQAEVESYYDARKNKDDKTPVEYGLNSRLVKEGNKITEKTYKIDGLYSEAIAEIVGWLNKAKAVAETETQKKNIETLIDYYKTGNLKTWDDYNIQWVTENDARIDFVNGFIEVYSDPLGMKATWESVVNFKDLESTKRTEIISNNAQWFEDHSPVNDQFKKKKVKGVTAKVITVATLGGDCYPHTPIGINLPNSNWIRKEHGSKSVTIENITHAYHQASLSAGSLEEFSYDDEEIRILKEYGYQTGNLHTDLHECLGHGSGQLLPGVSGEALKNYSSSLEETRADLFALYYIMDPKMVELGLLPNEEAAKAEYIAYIRNGLMTQLRRIELGKNIEQAHMRNRQLISRWCYEHGKKDNVIEKIKKDDKTYYKINDFKKLRELFGELLAEVQRIKSEGDYEAGKNLVENYGVKIDKELHKEVLNRYEKLNLPAYQGFVNPEYEVIKEGDKITDIKVHYVSDYAQQMMNYSRNYSFLPSEN